MISAGSAGFIPSFQWISPAATDSRPKAKTIQIVGTQGILFKATCRLYPSVGADLRGSEQSPPESAVKR